MALIATDFLLWMHDMICHFLCDVSRWSKQVTLTSLQETTTWILISMHSHLTRLNRRQRVFMLTIADFHSGDQCWRNKLTKARAESPSLSVPSWDEYYSRLVPHLIRIDIDMLDTDIGDQMIRLISRAICGQLSRRSHTLTPREAITCFSKIFSSWR